VAVSLDGFTGKINSSKKSRNVVSLEKSTEAAGREVSSNNDDDLIFLVPNGADNDENQEKGIILISQTVRLLILNL
jgi:hypothetical protein